MVAIIIGTHGKFSQEILNSTKMICGEQSNIACITFEPGEGIELLLEKYDEQLESLDTSDGTLIMVDLLNGSPFNTAIKKTVLSDNIEIITGVNMPMLVEVLMSREFLNLKELVDIAKNSGTGGIQTKEEILYANEMEEL